MERKKQPKLYKHTLLFWPSRGRAFSSPGQPDPAPRRLHIERAAAQVDLLFLPLGRRSDSCRRGELRHGCGLSLALPADFAHVEAARCATKPFAWPGVRRPAHLALPSSCNMTFIRSAGETVHAFASMATDAYRGSAAQPEGAGALDAGRPPLRSQMRAAAGFALPQCPVRWQPARPEPAHW